MKTEKEMLKEKIKERFDKFLDNSAFDIEYDDKNYHSVKLVNSFETESKEQIIEKLFILQMSNRNLKRDYEDLKKQFDLCSNEFKKNNDSVVELRSILNRVTVLNNVIGAFYFHLTKGTRFEPRLPDIDDKKRD